MNYNDVIYGSVNCDEFNIDDLELSARLGYTASACELQAHIDEFNSAASYRYAYARVSLKISGDECDFGFGKARSSSLAKVLEGCSEALIFAVSCGTATDRLISRLYLQSSANAFITDAIGSASAEALADLVNKKICDGLSVTKRFSPGYADFPIDFQKPLLERLNAFSTVGISLTNDLLMIPMKSVTAVIGIR